MTDDITVELVKLVIRELAIDPARIGPDTPLFEGGLELDSFAVVDLVMRIETHFGVQFSDADFLPETFADFRTLGAVVAGYVAAGSVAGPVADPVAGQTP